MLALTSLRPARGRQEAHLSESDPSPSLAGTFPQTRLLGGDEKHIPFHFRESGNAGKSGQGTGGEHVACWGLWLGLVSNISVVSMQSWAVGSGCGEAG